MQESSGELLYHLSKSLEAQQQSLTAMRDDLHQMRVDIEVLKTTIPMVPQIASRKERTLAATAGGGIGAFFVALITLAIEYFKAKAGS